jgi:hypothetical protein
MTWPLDHLLPKYSWKLAVCNASSFVVLRQGCSSKKSRRLPDAIAQAPLLTTVRFSPSFNCSLALMERLRNIREIELCQYSWPFRFNTVLSPFRSTLQVLDLSYECGSAQPLSSHDLEGEWPQLHTLRLGTSIVTLQLLVSVFPRLQNLSLSFTTRVEPDTGSQCWPSLNSLRGAVGQLQTLQLRCVF